MDWLEIVKVLSVDGEYAEVRLSDNSVEWWSRHDLPDDVLPGDALVVDVDTGTGIYLLPRIGGTQS